jgi:hypothetical protein
MKAKAFDDQFERGEDITPHLDLSKAIRPDCQQKRVNVDFTQAQPSCETFDIRDRTL